MHLIVGWLFGLSIYSVLQKILPALLNLSCLFGGSWGAQMRTKESLSGSLLFTSLATVHPERGTPPTSLSILIKLVSSAAAPKPCEEEQIACLVSHLNQGNDELTFDIIKQKRRSVLDNPSQHLTPCVSETLPRQPHA